jgi:hypothetical protein
MEKKIYTTPTLSVEEYEMIVITGASQITNSTIMGNSGLSYGGAGDGSDQRAKNRGGIWDEE